MGIFGLLILVVIILAIIGLGWTTFSSGVITGFEKAVYLLGCLVYAEYTISYVTLDTALYAIVLPNEFLPSVLVMNRISLLPEELSRVTT
jgi:hypothetical protein